MDKDLKLIRDNYQKEYPDMSIEDIERKMVNDISNIVCYETYHTGFWVCGKCGKLNENDTICFNCGMIKES